MSQRLSRKRKESWKSVINLMNKAKTKKQYTDKDSDEEANKPLEQSQSSIELNDSHVLPNSIVPLRAEPL